MVGFSPYLRKDITKLSKMNLNSLYSPGEISTILLPQLLKYLRLQAQLFCILTVLIDTHLYILSKYPLMILGGF